MQGEGAFERSFQMDFDRVLVSSMQSIRASKGYEEMGKEVKIDE
jgi:hypothetical protein